MRLFVRCVATLLLAGAAFAHPHPGGIVVRDDRVLVGDVVRSRLLILQGPHIRELDVGHVRDLQEGPDGAIYGVNQGRGGLWKLGPGDTQAPVRPEFNGLFAVCADGGFAYAPADENDRRLRLHYRDMTPLFDQLEALLCVGTTIYFADDRAVRMMDRLGAITTLAEDVGGRMYGLTTGPHGPIAAVYDTGQVIEVQSRRVLATSEAPWRPVDVAMRDGVLYVVELAQYPCCFKGPRVRRIRAGESTTLLALDDGNHLHLVRWLPATAGVVLVTAIIAAIVIRRRRSGAG